ncbi:bifunctional 4-hydroxy-2-oxoglutarate aldolase/2-dehydro-3-deoxy-phosphogluconate aldolase [Microvirga sp. G4-2]|uniref:bifunctional 4-hydroxy-2-oxoglutarate aldolase/2-dehydro-3-deoxy-phosphogluconate aldolase n=1 Tax=Microvirga sp. G4-2 TaxID=3434467 RepID=UPI004043B245
MRLDDADPTNLPSGPIRDAFSSSPIIPVITIERIEDAVPLAQALVEGGLKVLEITLRTPVALHAAAAIINGVPEAVVGLGTVTSDSDLDQAKRIGAQFALSPGATPRLLDAAADSGLPFIPGVATASEIMAARERGFTLLKFFPAAFSGGINALRAFSGPFPDIRFCPTGGISEANASEWLALQNVIAVGGSWLTPAEDIRRGAWDAITERTQRTLAGLSGIRK